MLKFLRNYSKILIAFFGCLLMVAFLLPQALTQFGQQRPSRPVARINGQSVTAMQMSLAQRDLQILSDVMGQRMLLQLGVQGLDHWYLLVHEAKQAGLMGGEMDGRSVLTDTAERAAQMNTQQALMFQQNVTPEKQQETYNTQLATIQGQFDRLRSEVMSKYNVDAPVIDNALSQYRGVLRLLEMYYAASNISAPEALAGAASVLDTAVTDVLIIPGSSIASSTVPDDVRAAAFFEQYKSVREGEGEFGIGYLRPPAVRVEWIGLDANAAMSKLPIDPIEVNKYWQLNKARFAQDFASARPTVEGEFKKNTFTKIAARFREIIQRESQRSLVGVPEKDGYHELPADWSIKKPAIADLVAKAKAELSREFGIPELDFSVSNALDLWMTAETFRNLPQFSSARYVINDRQQLPAADYVFTARELGAAPSPIGIEKDVLEGPLASFDGSIYFIRLFDTRGETPPDSFEEVRAEALRDMRMLEGYQKMRETKDALLARASEAWLGSIGLEYQAQPEIGLLITRESIATSTGTTPNPDLNVPEFRNKVMDLVKDWDPKAEVSQIELTRRTTSFDLPKKMSMAFAQVTARRPPTVEQYRTAGQRLTSAAIQRFTEGLVFNDLSPEALFKRHKFEVLDADGEARQPDADAPAAAETPGTAKSAS